MLDAGVATELIDVRLDKAEVKGDEPVFAPSFLLCPLARVLGRWVRARDKRIE